MKSTLPIGKLPIDLLANTISDMPLLDPRIILGPGIGLDCAVIDIGDKYLVLKSDPITFATEDIGWYAVQINANDIVTTGADPYWFISTLLLPAKQTNQALVEKITKQISAACTQIGVSVIGGHTEITHNLDRPILVGTMIGEVPHDRLITPLGAVAEDRILLSKGVPIEATSILAREFSNELLNYQTSQSDLNLDDIELAQGFLHHPGISVLQEAKIAANSSEVHAMHDATEGGLYTALWELAAASGLSLWAEPTSVYIPSVSRRICQKLGIDPLGAIASGALLIVAPAGSSHKIQQEINSAGIHCSEIGHVLGKPSNNKTLQALYESVNDGVVISEKLNHKGSEDNLNPAVFYQSNNGPQFLPHPERDENTKLFEE